jgi:hypothetical protein
MNPQGYRLLSFDGSIGMVYEEQIYAAAMDIPGGSQLWRLSTNWYIVAMQVS